MREPVPVTIEFLDRDADTIGICQARITIGESGAIGDIRTVISAEPAPVVSPGAVALHVIDPGKPIQNAHCESFHGRLRDECLNAQWFLGLADARRLVEAWRQDGHRRRPDSALGDRTPEEFRRAADEPPITRQELAGLSSCLDQSTGAGQNESSSWSLLGSLTQRGTPTGQRQAPSRQVWLPGQAPLGLVPSAAVAKVHVEPLQAAVRQAALTQ